MKSHMKRLRAPKSWRIEKKGIKFVIRPNPGPHSFSLGLPLLVVLRDVLHYAKNSAEAKKILFSQEILIDGIRRKEPKFIVGFMDVVSIPKLKQHFRVLLDKKGKFSFVQIKEDEINIKPCKIIKKSMVRKKLQLNLFDGKNVLVEKGDFKIGDTVVLELPGQAIKTHLKLEKGATIYLTAGNHTGESGVVEEIKKENIFYKRRTGEKFETKKDYAFVIGKDKPVIALEGIKK